jgi:purine-binding chemotaxis protein CheW
MGTVQDQGEQYLTFHIAGEEYAIGVLQIKEIIGYDVLTRLPGTTPAVRGVINLRGSVVPVVDLALRFGMAATEVTKLTCIIIVETQIKQEKIVAGILTDSVHRVLDLQNSDIEATPTFGARIDTECLKGMSKSGKKFLLILNIDKVLAGLDLSAGQTLPGPPALPMASNS